MHAHAGSGSANGYAEGRQSEPLREEVFPLVVVEGRVTLSDAPGLGVEPDLRRLAPYMVM